MGQFGKIFFVFLLACSVGLAGCGAKPASQGATSEETSQMEKVLQEEYVKQNRALTASQYEYYQNSDSVGKYINLVYVRLFNYVWEEKAELTYADIEEYLSQEYEDDGSVRIYNNGNWPEIEKYVEWLDTKTEDELSVIDISARSEQKEYGDKFSSLMGVDFLDLGMHNIRELVFASRDPEYVPNFNEETRATDEAKRAQEGASKG